MATASAITTDWTSKGKFTPTELSILKKPCAEAVKAMGCSRPDLIIYAAKLLELQKRPLHGMTLLLEVDKLEELERKGEDLPPLKPPSPVDSDSGSDFGSDFASDCDSMEYYSSHDPNEPPEIPIRKNTNKDDLETDCPPPMQSEKTRAIDVLPKEDLKNADIHQEPSTKEARKTDDILDRKQRLQVLRLENQRLKERQLCRQCRAQTVSVTFLPCGHYAFCYDCGQGFSSCPICYKTILADVKTFLA